MMARTAAHEQIDHPFGFRRMMQAADFPRLSCGQIICQQTGQGGGPESESGAAKQLPPRHHQFVLPQGV